MAKRKSTRKRMMSISECNRSTSNRNASESLSRTLCWLPTQTLPSASMLSHVAKSPQGMEWATQPIASSPTLSNVSCGPLSRTVPGQQDLRLGKNRRRLFRGLKLQRQDNQLRVTNSSSHPSRTAQTAKIETPSSQLPSRPLGKRRDQCEDNQPKSESPEARKAN